MTSWIKRLWDSIDNPNRFILFLCFIIGIGNDIQNEEVFSREMGKVIALLRCITVDEETLIASNCEKEGTRKLSNERKLQCPNCRSTVIFNSGRVKTYFSHYKSKCVVSNYEPETESHIKGKQILYEWLRNHYPSADVEYEVYIPETKQIADILVIQSGEDMEEVRLAFEFQHSRLSPSDWEKRHELYQLAGIQDFWILDKEVYMKFSREDGFENARLRKELEKAIYEETGFCYFLDLDNTEMTIDFHFSTQTKPALKKGWKPREFTIHSPINHSNPLKLVRIGLHKELKFGILSFPDIKNKLENRLPVIIRKWTKKRAREERLKFEEKVIEIRMAAEEQYGKEEADHLRILMMENKESLGNDIKNLLPQAFFQKYDELIQTLLKDVEEYKAIADREDLVDCLLRQMVREHELYSHSSLRKQGSHSLREHFMAQHQEKIDLVRYVYSTYNEELETIASYNPKSIASALKKINFKLWPPIVKPTTIDYAMEYRWLKNKEEADGYMKQVKERIIDDYEDW